MISKKTKLILFYITFAVLLYGAVMNIGTLFTGLKVVGDMLVPIFIGIIFAFVLNVPMTGLENFIRKMGNKFHLRINSKILEPLCLILTILGIGLVFYVAIIMLLPPLKESIETIRPIAQEKIPAFMEFLKDKGWNGDELMNELNMFTTKYSSHFSSLFTSAYSAVSTTFSKAFNVVVGLIVAVYILLSKASASDMVVKSIQAFLPEKAAGKVFKIANLVNTTYSKFLVGQTVEAFILGALMFVVFWLLKLPYPLLVGVLTGISAFIPYLGALLSCGIAVILCLLTAPAKLILCIGAYVVTQFIENQFIYPRVVGTSVGLSPLLTLLAALVGGSLFGLLGILFFIPLVACLNTLITEAIGARLAEKDTKKNKTQNKEESRPSATKAMQ